MTLPDCFNMDIDGVRSVIRHMNEKSRILRQELAEFKRNNPPLDESVIHEIDSTKSIDWNKTEAQRRNRSRNGSIGAYTAKINKCQDTIIKAMMDYIRDEHGFHGDIAQLIYDNAYERGHPCGYNEVLCYIDVYAEFAQKILDASE